MPWSEPESRISPTPCGTPATKPLRVGERATPHGRRLLLGDTVLAMSEANVELVRRLYAKWKDAFEDLDDEAYDLLDPEIERDVSSPDLATSREK